MLENRHVPPPVDFGRLHIVAGTDQEKASLLGIFFRVARELLTTLENSRKNEELLKWKSTAHSMKGAAANLGMSALEGTCRQAEKSDNLTWDQRSVLLAQIRTDVERIRIYLANENPNLLQGE